MQLEVLNFTLPSTTALKSAFGLSSGGCDELGFPDCQAHQETQIISRELFVRSALNNRVSVMSPHESQLRLGNKTNLAEFRKYVLPFLNGTAATRLPGARLTTYAVTRPKDLDLAGWRGEFEAQGLTRKAFVYACDEPYFFPVYGDSVGNWKLC